MENKKNILALFFGGILIAGLFFWLGNRSTAKTPSNNDRITIAEAKAKTDINQEFSFPVLNDAGVKAFEVQYTIENAELRNEVVIKSQKGTSVKGRIFLVLGIKLKNNYNNKIQINTGNYVRLSVNNNENEWLAPEMHNDPVEVQPISTKYTKVGFTINETDKNIKLQVGEINSDKEIIEVKFN